VHNAIRAMYRDLEYAKTLIKARQVISKPTEQGLTGSAAGRAAALMDYETEADLEGEESWTFIGNENEVEPELKRRMNISPGGREPRVSLDALRAGGRAIGNVKLSEHVERATTKERERDQR
jgi:hypothetical protein